MSCCAEETVFITFSQSILEMTEEKLAAINDERRATTIVNGIGEIIRQLYPLTFQYLMSALRASLRVRCRDSKAAWQWFLRPGTLVELADDLRGRMATFASERALGDEVIRSMDLESSARDVILNWVSGGCNMPNPRFSDRVFEATRACTTVLQQKSTAPPQNEQELGEFLKLVEGRMRKQEARERRGKRIGDRVLANVRDGLAEADMADDQLVRDSLDDAIAYSMAPLRDGFGDSILYTNYDLEDDSKQETRATTGQSWLRYAVWDNPDHPSYRAFPGDVFPDGHVHPDPFIREWKRESRPVLAGNCPYAWGEHLTPIAHPERPWDVDSQKWDLVLFNPYDPDHFIDKSHFEQLH